MSFRLGLTGSIGMGKSTTARMFAEAGVPVWDADATVHRLYGPGQAGALAIARLFPDAMAPDGAVRRDRLRGIIQADQTALDRINAAIHPLVAADRAAFIAAHDTAPILLLDIPLLFEIGAERDCNAVVVVTAPEGVQRTRVLARGLPEVEFAAILARQLPDVEKRARADYVITTTSLESAQAAVKDVLGDIHRRLARDA
ncbi:MAG: dephospho-CoA kinase [Rhodobacterales bacterium 12-65-15]|nr:MAG: dephospho-CoA kinase [Rhodobacterales bacterium 12-65-15]